MMLLIALSIGCRDDEIRPVSCSTTSVEDDSYLGTSLSAERQRFHDDLAAHQTDWNVFNDLGAVSDQLTLDPLAFSSDEAYACTYSDDGSLQQMSAPVSVAVVGESWVPATTEEGTLLMDANSGVYLLVEFLVPVAEDLRATAETLIEAEMGVDVETADVPSEALLSVGTAGPETGYWADLSFSPDQTVAYEAGPEPMGATVPLAKTER